MTRFRALHLSLLAFAIPVSAQYSTIPPFIPPTSGETARLLVAVGGTAPMISLVGYDDPDTCHKPRRVPRLGEPIQIPAQRALTFTAYLAKGEEACRFTFNFQPQAGFFYEVYSSMKPGLCVVQVSQSQRPEGPYTWVRDAKKMRYVAGENSATSYCESL